MNPTPERTSLLRIRGRKRFVLALLLVSGTVPTGFSPQASADTYRNPFFKRSETRSKETSRTPVMPASTQISPAAAALAPTNDRGWVDQPVVTPNARGTIVSPMMHPRQTTPAPRPVSRQLGVPTRLAQPSHVPTGAPTIEQPVSVPGPAFTHTATPRPRPLRLPPVPSKPASSSETIAKEKTTTAASLAKLSAPTVVSQSGEVTLPEPAGTDAQLISSEKRESVPLPSTAMELGPAEMTSVETVAQQPEEKQPGSEERQLGSNAKSESSTEEHLTVSETAPDQPTKTDASWLQSITPTVCQRKSLELLDDANREYAVKAWVSAEASAWESLTYAAQAIDVADRQTGLIGSSEGQSAMQDLVLAKTALREARDFLMLTDSLDHAGIRRMVQSHQTNVLKEVMLQEEGKSGDTTITASVAADRYLDHARQLLARLAKYQVSAAATLDLLAAIQLGRNEATRMPVATALCLRRAAFQGQPGNASLASRLGMQLADMGLDNEAKWTLEHAVSMDPNPQPARVLAEVIRRGGDRKAAMELTAQLKQDFQQRNAEPRVPEVIHLTPEQFASISPSVNAPSANAPTAATPVSASRAMGSTQPSPGTSANVSQSNALQPNGTAARAVGYRQNVQPISYGSSTNSPSNTPIAPNVVAPVVNSSYIEPTRAGDEYTRQNPYMKPNRPRVSKVQQMLGKLSEMW